MDKPVVGILLFNEVEVLDFAGPYEVFANAMEEMTSLYEVITIGETTKPIHARYGLTVVPAYDFETAPAVDILIVPGGYGAEHIEIKNQVLLDWIRYQAQRVTIVASVCTGAFLLAEAGLLKGKKATTHWLDYNKLQQDYPEVEVIRDVRFVDEQRILTAGGISAGLDLALHIVARISGKDIAQATARRMEIKYESLV
jgi:transcriptional regulator GlxA family with amidase domain